MLDVCMNDDDESTNNPENHEILRLSTIHIPATIAQGLLLPLFGVFVYYFVPKASSLCDECWPLEKSVLLENGFKMAAMGFVVFIVTGWLGFEII